MRISARISAFHLQTDDLGAVRQEVPDPLATNFTSKNVAKGSWGAESTYLPPGMLTRGRQDKGRVLLLLLLY